MATKGGHIDFMFLSSLCLATGPTTAFCYPTPENFCHTTPKIWYPPPSFLLSHIPKYFAIVSLNFFYCNPHKVLPSHLQKPFITAPHFLPPHFPKKFGIPPSKFFLTPNIHPKNWHHTPNLFSAALC